MNAKNPDDYVPKIARNELFYFVARASTLAATLIGLPIAGFMLSRVVTQADALTSTVIQQNVDIKVLSATLKEQLSMNAHELSDHELRLRQLERKN